MFLIDKVHFSYRQVLRQYDKVKVSPWHLPFQYKQFYLSIEVLQELATTMQYFHSTRMTYAIYLTNQLIQMQ